MSNNTLFQQKYGSWAVITGASSGIGEALAEETAMTGLNVVLVARSEGKLNALAETLTQKYGVEAKVVSADLGSVEGVKRVEEKTADLDVGLFIASAGFGTSGHFLQNKLEDELAMLDVNCRSLVMLTHHYGQAFKARGRGGIILLASIVGFQGMPNAAHYSATKAYVHTLAEGLQVELAPHGVAVLASAPGPTSSGFAARADMQMGAALSPSEVAKGTLSALGKRTIALPGFLSKLLVYGLAPLPRWARVRIMGNVMHGMTKHQQANLTPRPNGATV